MATHRRHHLWAALASAALCLSGCLAGCTSTRDDVTFNPYRSNDGDPSLLQSADGLMEGAEEWLGDLDLRIEHAVY